jgi:L-fuconolactonase
VALVVTGKYRYPTPRTDWLERRSEAVLDPGLPIVDAHHHLWEERGNPYQVDDLLADLGGGHRIVATIFAECHFAHRIDGPEHLRPVGETERVEILRRVAYARRPDQRPCAGIIGYADLCDERLDEVLDAHVAASPGHFRAIRQSVARDSHFPDGIVLRPAPAGMLANAALRRGVRRLGDRGLVFDAMLYHEQIPELTALAAAVTDTTIVLDHYGCPIGVGPYQGREAERFVDWQRDVRALARAPNVQIKLGGLGMIVTGSRYHLADEPPGSEQLAADWRPWVLTCIEAFGAERCIFESNFPVDKAMYSYTVLWNAFKRIAAGCSAAERDGLFRATAARTYRLDLS